MFEKKKKILSKKRISIFSTFFMNALAASLLVSALGTKSWVFSKSCKNVSFDELGIQYNCKCNFGLFSGSAEFQAASDIPYNYKSK